MVQPRIIFYLLSLSGALWIFRIIYFAKKVSNKIGFSFGAQYIFTTFAEHIMAHLLWCINFSFTNFQLLTHCGRTKNFQINWCGYRVGEPIQQRIRNGMTLHQFRIFGGLISACTLARRNSNCVCFITINGLMLSFFSFRSLLLLLVLFVWQLVDKLPSTQITSFTIIQLICAMYNYNPSWQDQTFLILLNLSNHYPVPFPDFLLCIFFVFS